MKNETDVVIQEYAPAVRERSSVLLMPVMDLQTAMSRLNQFQEFISNYLQESNDGGNDGGDYGVIPGTKKKTLLKSGADKLCEVYGLYDEYAVISSVEDWDKGLFDYTLKCLLKSRRDDSMVGTGVGSCSSYESKYRWREQAKKCPDCNSEAIIKGKKDYGGGWLCWNKKGGCGAKFKDGDRAIEGQPTGRVDNPDIIDIKNTVLKMAKKRAKIDATIGATRSSGIFTQDMDELVRQPAANAPEVATESVTFTKPMTAEKAETPKAEKPATIETGFIDGGKQVNFAARFRESLQKEFQKDAEKLRHEWLGRHSYIDKDGNPTSKAIPDKDFEAVKSDACAWAKKYRPFAATENDLPDNL